MLAEKVVHHMFSTSFTLGILWDRVTALKVCATMGWVPNLNWERLWRMAQAPLDSAKNRPEGPEFGGLDVLQFMGSCSLKVGDWKVYVEVVLSCSPCWHGLTKVNTCIMCWRGLQNKDCECVKAPATSRRASMLMH